MAGSNNKYIKKQKAELRLKKRKAKEQKKAERRENSPGGGFESMIAYVDKFGNITPNKPVEEAIEQPEGEQGKD
jgi:S-adenosylmethionine hydrolase